MLNSEVSDRTIYFDVDDTLVMHDIYKFEEKDRVWISSKHVGCMEVVPHKKHIELLKEYKAQGFGIIVWSMAGGQWAKDVVLALGLESYVDAVAAKPEIYVDDFTVTEWWRGKHIYYHPESTESMQVEAKTQKWNTT